MTLKELMNHVGSGPKSAEDMTYSQSSQAFASVLEGGYDDTTLGAFWLANRWKRNTPEELAGFLDAMRERVRTAEPSVDPVDCGANYDGKRSTALLGVAAGVVAAAAGTPVVVHSGDRVPTHEGATYKHVLDDLGVRTELSPGESRDMVDDTGFGYYYQPSFNPAVHGLLPRRREMGVRTFVNTVETMANPAGADVHLGSFYHLAFARKVVDAFDRSEVEVDRVIMFQGLEGYDDVRPGYTKVAEWSGDFSDYEIRTGDYGMDFGREDLEVGDVPRDSARITREVLAGERRDGFRDAVLLNAALRIYARGDASTLEDGLDSAESAVESGDAVAVLEAVRDV